MFSLVLQLLCQLQISCKIKKANQYLKVQAKGFLFYMIIIHPNLMHISLGKVQCLTVIKNGSNLTDKKWTWKMKCITANGVHVTMRRAVLSYKFVLQRHKWHFQFQFQEWWKKKTQQHDSDLLSMLSKQGSCHHNAFMYCGNTEGLGRVIGAVCLH